MTGKWTILPALALTKAVKLLGKIKTDGCERDMPEGACLSRWPDDSDHWCHGCAALAFFKEFET